MAESIESFAASYAAAKSKNAYAAYYAASERLYRAIADHVTTAQGVPVGAMAYYTAGFAGWAVQYAAFHAGPTPAVPPTVMQYPDNTGRLWFQGRDIDDLLVGADADSLSRIMLANYDAMKAPVETRPDPNAIMQKVVGVLMGDWNAMLCGNVSPQDHLAVMTVMGPRFREFLSDACAHADLVPVSAMMMSKLVRDTSTPATCGNATSALLETAFFAALMDYGMVAVR